MYGMAHHGDFGEMLPTVSMTMRAFDFYAQFLSVFATLLAY
jgi:hypothetical protein